MPRLVSFPSSPRPVTRRTAFTLVELLVVIGIIALLISILLPSLASARQSAAVVKSLSNLRQLGIGIEMYRSEHRGLYPVGGYPAPTPRMRWADAILPYLKNTEVFMSPLLDPAARERMKKPFAHTCNPDGSTRPDTIYFGGYGYNYQYLGNGRHGSAAGIPENRTPFYGRTKDIRVPTETVAVADTDGSKDGYAAGEGVYVIDPPLQSLNLGSKGSRKNLNAPAASGNYGYRGGSDGEDPVTSLMRAKPVERSKGKVGVVFCDGHGETLTLKQLDDKNGDGVWDNGYWNGRGDSDPTVR